MPRLLLIKVIFCWSSLMLVGSGTVAASLIVQTKPGCPDKCGNVSIHYPFGIFDAAGGEECSINGVGIGYGITCNTSYNPPRAFLGKGNLEILSISDSELRVKTNQVATVCHTKTGSMIEEPEDKDISWYIGRTWFTFSSIKNRLFGIGCDTTTISYTANAVERNISVAEYSSLCRSTCDTRENIEEGSCNGSGCCHLIIPKGINFFQANVYTSSDNHTKVWSFDHCSYGILAEQDAYTFHASDLLLSSTDFIVKGKGLPLVLDWAIGNKTCEEARDSGALACQENSNCINSDNNLGYRCSCFDGYEGNPYLSPGCQEDSIGDGRKDGHGCSTKKQVVPILKLALGN
ncbi:hypothetical protein MKW92_053105 [Papaver armeniacum]|nr:hypothetical protein MKW92_053105 [Papaver armeniacum]